MAVNPGDILRVVLKFSYPYTSQIQNVFHLHVAETGTAQESVVVQDLEDLFSAMYSNLNSVMSDAMGFIEGVVDVLEAVNGVWEAVSRVGTFTALPLFNPTDLTHPLPPAVSALVLVNTLTPGHQGRKFVSSFPEGQNDSDGEPNVGVPTVLATTFGDYFLGEYPITGTSLVMIPVILDSKALTPFFRYADDVVASGQWAYQRRRKRYIGI